MEKIEKIIVELLGYHALPVEINNVQYWQVLDMNNHPVGFVAYGDEEKDVHHIKINSPTVYLETKRKKSSNEVEIQYEIRNKYATKDKGKNKIIIKM